MKFVISTQELNGLISKCLNVVSPKMAIPILSNILIEAANDELLLTATDLTVGIRCFTEAKILEEGATTLPAKILAQLLRELVSSHVEISTNPQQITEIVSNSSKFKLNGMSKEEFPSLPMIHEAASFTLSQADLKAALFRTAFAVSKEDSRYMLTGVQLKLDGDQALFVGTDGKKLSRACVSISIGEKREDPAFRESYIIPLKAVEEIEKNLGGDASATVYLMKDKIAVEVSHATIITKLLAGEYPDVDRIIPSHCPVAVPLHREELTRLLRQMSLFIMDLNQSVRFTFQEGELILTANSVEVGGGKVSMPAHYHGPKLDVAFNPQFFLDILKHSKEEVITLGLIDAYNPGIIVDHETLPATITSSTSLFILMPMRLNNEEMA